MALVSNSKFVKLRGAWLLSLILLMPLAQALATWHVLSHSLQEQVLEPAQTQAPAPDAAGKSKAGLHHEHCDLCVIAAAVLGGAHPATSPPLPPLSLVHQAPLATPAAHWIALAALPYQSRAPPLLQL